MYAVCMMILWWARTRHGPEIGCFPLVDFGSRVAAGGRTDDSLASVLAPLSGSPNIRETLEGKTIRLLEPLAKVPGQNEDVEEVDGSGKGGPWLRAAEKGK